MYANAIVLYCLLFIRTLYTFSSYSVDQSQEPVAEPYLEAQRLGVIPDADCMTLHLDPMVKVGGDLGGLSFAQPKTIQRFFLYLGKLCT